MDTRTVQLLAIPWLSLRASDLGPASRAKVVSEGLGFSRSTHPSEAAIFPSIRASRSSAPALPSRRPGLTRVSAGLSPSVTNPVTLESSQTRLSPTQPSPVSPHRSAWPPHFRVSAKTTRFTTGLRTDKMHLPHLNASPPSPPPLSRPSARSTARPACYFPEPGTAPVCRVTQQHPGPGGSQQRACRTAAPWAADEEAQLLTAARLSWAVPGCLLGSRTPSLNSQLPLQLRVTR
ncbi:uncharacterized protein LOC116596228 [Mustela erminea]|uniref:uncharacterized protein LOC116596228 n=1 Tax=Mustela erminea TaxID=36723 RepID=UPI001386F728|nr:uncharacterized protein LOC116596228 [Mustela erminea]